MRIMFNSERKAVDKELFCDAFGNLSSDYSLILSMLNGLFLGVIVDNFNEFFAELVQ